MTVLVVDDEERIRILIKEYCLNEDYNVLEASDGKEALNIIKNNSERVISSTRNSESFSVEKIKINYTCLKK